MITNYKNTKHMSYTKHMNAHLNQKIFASQDFYILNIVKYYAITI